MARATYPCLRPARQQEIEALADQPGISLMVELLAGKSLGGEIPGGEIPGGEIPGGEIPGGEIPGGEIPGGEIPGGEIPDGEDSGGGADWEPDASRARRDRGGEGNVPDVFGDFSTLSWLHN